MKKQTFLFTWLFAKALIVCFLSIIVCCNTLFTGWFQTGDPLKQVEKTIKKMGVTTQGVATKIDSFNKAGFSALMEAAAAGKLNYVEALVKRGADVNEIPKSKKGNTALHLGCYNGREKVAKFLIDQNANTIVYNKSDVGATPLHFTVGMYDNKDFREVIRAFVYRGTDLNIPDKKNGYSLLFWTLDRNDSAKTELLIKEFGQFIDFDLRDKFGRTALGYVKKTGLIELLDAGELLKKAMRPQKLDATINVSGYLKSGLTRPMTYALKGDIRTLKALITRGAQINLADRTPLGNSALHWSCSYNRPKSIEILVKNGANVNLKNRRGETPMLCVWGIRNDTDRKKVIRLFMDKGARINATDNWGNTLLQNMVDWGQMGVIKELLRDFSLFIHFKKRNKKGRTALDIAKRRKEPTLIKLLAPFYMPIGDNQINRLNKQGYTPLMVATLRGDVQSATDLIRRGANLNQKGKGGNTALHLGIKYRNMDIVQLLLKNPHIKVTIKNDLGNTPLFEVIHLLKENDRQMVTIELLKKGADISTANKTGTTIVNVAQEKKLSQYIQFLKRYIGKIMSERIDELLKKK